LNGHSRHFRAIAEKIDQIVADVTLLSLDDIEAIRAEVDRVAGSPFSNVQPHHPQIISLFLQFRRGLEAL
jgi:hypothetical protein